MTRRRPPTDPCPDPHEYGPATLPEWQAWAAARTATHELHTCPDCGLAVLWVPRAEDTVDPDDPVLFDLGAAT